MTHFSVCSHFQYVRISLFSGALELQLSWKMFSFLASNATVYWTLHLVAIVHVGINTAKAFGQTNWMTNSVSETQRNLIISICAKDNEIAYWILLWCVCNCAIWHVCVLAIRKWQKSHAHAITWHLHFSHSEQIKQLLVCRLMQMTFFRDMPTVKQFQQWNKSPCEQYETNRQKKNMI